MFFDLVFHPWNQFIDLVIKKANYNDIQIIIPK